MRTRAAQLSLCLNILVNTKCIYYVTTLSACAKITVLNGIHLKSLPDLTETRRDWQSKNANRFSLNVCGSIIKIDYLNSMKIGLHKEIGYMIKVSISGKDTISSLIKGMNNLHAFLFLIFIVGMFVSNWFDWLVTSSSVVASGFSV